MTASDIQLLRKHFNMGAPQDNHWSHANNALYGYLAWNIGNERVLCSPYQDHRICIRLPKENIQLAPNINKDGSSNPPQVCIVSSCFKYDKNHKFPGVEEFRPLNTKNE